MGEKIRNFYDLKVWKDAHSLVLQIYKITKYFPSDEKFGLTNQIRRAVSSVSANIAEGFGRFHFKDKIKFYHQARGSAVELQNHLILGKDLGYLDNTTAKNLFSQAELVLKEMNGLIASINRQQDSI